MDRIIFFYGEKITQNRCLKAENKLLLKVWIENIGGSCELCHRDESTEYCAKWMHENTTIR